MSTNQLRITRPEYSYCDAVAAEILHVKGGYPSAKVNFVGGDVKLAF